MNKIQYLILCLFLLACNVSFAQSESLLPKSVTEYTTKEEILKMYIDSIHKYVYRDIELTSQYIDECRKIVNTKITISDSLMFKLVVSEIYLAYSEADPVEAYRLISEYENELPKADLTEKQINGFNFLTSFTYMELGDLEAAQKSYYTEIESGKQTRDTSRIVNSLYSLGILLDKESDFSGAVKCYVEALELIENDSTKTRTKVLIYKDLGEAYISLKDYENSRISLLKGQDLSQAQDYSRLETDVLFHLGNLYVEEDNLVKAKEVYDKLVSMIQGEKDFTTKIYAKKILAKIYRQEKKYVNALTLINDIISITDTSKVLNLLNAYESGHQIASQIQDYESAYNYQSKYTELYIKKDKDTRKQKTDYLKVKYDSEQKEKNNLLLQLELEKSQSRQKISNLLIALSILAFLILCYALWQRRQYSIRLEKEVQKRTNKLEESNYWLTKSYEEIDEFNRIISHDLTEPLRSIVSFSQLASRDVHEPQKAIEHLQLVTKSGEQLNRLIKDIGVYRELSSIRVADYKDVNLNELLTDVNKIVQANYPNKNIVLNYDQKQFINCPPPIIQQVLTSIIDNSSRYNTNQNVTIDINYKLDHGVHKIELRDNGIGIPTQYHSQVFKMFKRLNNRESYTGSGLGLSIAQKLIEKIGGQIAIKDSKMGVSTTVAVNFPSKSQQQNR